MNETGTDTGQTPGRRRLEGGRLRVARTVLVLSSVLLVLGAAEIVLRTTSMFVSYETGGAVSPLNNANGIIQMTPRGKRLVPGARVVINNHWISKRNIEVAINRDGFRGSEIEPKQPGERRILVLGDSITEADYLHNSEVWVTRLGPLLRSEGGPPVSVVNGGINDSGLEDQIHLLEDRGLAVEPDIVLLAFYLNDSRPAWGFPGELGRPGWLRRNSALADALYRMMKLHYWMKEKGEERFAWPNDAARLDWKGDSDAFLELAGKALYDWGAAWDSDSWPVIAAGLDRLGELGRANGFRPLAVVFPVRYQVEAAHLEDAPQRRFADLCAQRGIPILDLLPLLREKVAGADAEIFYDHCHPVPEANAWIAEWITEFLLKEGVLVP